VQIAGFTFASLFQPPEEETFSTVDRAAELDAATQAANAGALIFVKENAKMFKVRLDVKKNKIAIEQP